MSDATVVGSTRVSLIPDMSQFGDRLRIELPSAIRDPAKAAGDLAGDLIRNAISKKLAKPIGVKVKAALDDATARTGLDKLTRDRTVKVVAELDDKAATASLDKLTRDRKVRVVAEVDDSAAKTKLGALSGQQTVDILPRLQQAALRQAEAQLTRLVQDRVVHVRVDLDARAAAADLRTLTQNRTVRVTADADTARADAALAALTRNRRVTIDADVDTAAVTARLAALTRDRTVNVRVNTRGLGALTTGLGGIGSSSGGSAGGLGILSSRIAKLTALALTSLPTIASLASAIAQMGPLAATAAPAVAALAGAFAAFKVGTMGVGDAIKAAFQPATGEASKAATAVRQVENAQRQLANATRGVADAERALSEANRQARQAQQDLNAARRQAVRDLEDMNAQLRQGALDQEQAALDVKQAQLDLDKVRSDPTATQLQIEQADLALQRAKAAAEEQSRQQKRLQADTAAANKAGVEGSDVVVQAKERLRQANLQVEQQERALADAHRAVADAAKAVAEAQEKAATQTSKLDTALAKLSPNARAFVNELRTMAPAWRDMRLDVQDRLFSGIGTRLGQVGAQILPTVRSGLVGAAGELNIMGKNALTAVSNLQKSGQLKQVFDGVKQSLGNVSRIPGQLVTGFAQLSIAAQPAFDRLTKGAAGTVDRVMDRLSQKLKDGSLTDAINNALDVAGQFWQVLKDIGSIIGSIFKAAKDAGGDFFGTVGAAIHEIAKVLKSPEVQAALTQIFKALNAVAKLFAGTLGAVLQALLPVLAALAPVVQQLAEQFGPVLADLAKSLGEALMPIVQALAPVVETIGGILVGIVQNLMPLLKPLGDLIAAIITALAPMFTALGDQLVPFIGALTQGLLPVVGALVPIVQSFGVFLGELAPLFPQLMLAILPLIPPLAQLTVALLDLTLQVITPLMPLIVGLAKLLTTVLTSAITTLVPAMTTVIDGITSFVTAISDGVKTVVDWFKWLYDVLLGHSIIPDIVNGAIGWFTGMLKSLVNLAIKIKDGVVKQFGKLKQGALDLWNSLWKNVSSTASSTWRAVRKGWDGFVESLTESFRSAVKGLGKVWGGLQNLVKAPIRFMIETVYNNGLVKVWNATASKIPGIPDMTKMTLPKGFARGGVLPGWSTWRDGDDQLVPMRRGEGVYVSEVMRDPYERQRLYAMNAAAMRGQHPAIARAQYGFAEGGILGGIKSIGSSIADGVGSVLKKGENAVRGGLADVAEAAFKPIKNGINKVLGTNVTTWPGAVAHAPLNFIDRAIDYIRGKDIPESSGQWIKPVNVPFGTRFGVRGSMWSSGRHTGLDFPAPVGRKVVAVDNGTVQSATSGGPYGKHVMISHGGGLQSLYAHMSAIAAKVGAGIKQGARIGSVGATGNVTGPHLHLEARVNGRAVDPMPYLTGGGDGGSGVQRWRGVVQQALGQVHQSLGLVNTTLRRMNQESAGNPRAVNRTDSNWKAGHPSVGLMQLIDSTFRAYAGPYKNTGPKLYGVSVDPLANVYASMRYALARYGSLSRAYNRPGGYAMGGILGGVRISRGLPRGYAGGGVIKVGGKRIDTGPIAASVGRDFLKQLAGTAAQIDAAMSKVATAIKNAFKGVKTTLDDKLLANIKTQTGKLDALAKQRDAIAAKISAANQLAADSTNQANQFASLTSLPNGGNTFDAGGILGGLTTRLNQIKTFGKNIQTLAKRGLSKILLQQIISAGPDQGAAFAKALVDATPEQLRQINTVQAQISKASQQYGKDAADAMYDAGKQSGKGYLAGLKAQEKDINRAMSDLAKKIQQAIKKALKIKSPSRVFAELGKFTVQGFTQGVRAAAPEAALAASHMAAMVRSSATAASSRVENNTTSTTVGDRHLHYNATVREQASRQSILAALALDDALHRPVVVGG
jgi:murein DD-endopeptidase MepM/ murein hydrolase activator NlpD